MLCHYGSTIVSDTNNNIIYIDESIVFLNATTGTKKVICEKI